MARLFGWPLLLIAVASAVRLSGFDLTVSDHFFDLADQRFALRSEATLELVGHFLAKSLVLVVWFSLVAVSLASHAFGPLGRYRALLWSTVAAMALGPILVVVLKSVTPFQCPWYLQRYGGFAGEAIGWFVAPAQAGHCFPAGHSAGGFSLVAVYFGLRAAGRLRLARIGLAIAIAAGVAFSAVRIAQGAHFLSHTLWSAALDWFAAALIFMPRRTWVT